MDRKIELVRMVNPNAKPGEPTAGDFHPDERKALEAAGWRAAPTGDLSPAEILATKTDEELRLIAKEYRVKVPSGEREDLIAALLKAAGYETPGEPEPAAGASQEPARE